MLHGRTGFIQLQPSACRHSQSRAPAKCTANKSCCLLSVLVQQRDTHRAAACRHGVFKCLLAAGLLCFRHTSKHPQDDRHNTSAHHDVSAHPAKMGSSKKRAISTELMTRGDTGRPLHAHDGSVSGMCTAPAAAAAAAAAAAHQPLTPTQLPPPRPVKAKGPPPVAQPLSGYLHSGTGRASVRAARAYARGLQCTEREPVRGMGVGRLLVSQLPARVVDTHAHAPARWSINGWLCIHSTFQRQILPTACSCREQL